MPALLDNNGDIAREAIVGAEMLGFQINPRPDEGFVRYYPGAVKASAQILDLVLKPNSTTLIDIVLQRIVSKEVFRFEKTNGNAMPSDDAGDFSGTEPGEEFVS